MNALNESVRKQRRKRRLLRALSSKQKDGKGGNGKVEEKHEMFEARRKLDQKKEASKLLKKKISSESIEHGGANCFAGVNPKVVIDQLANILGAGGGGDSESFIVSSDIDNESQSANNSSQQYRSHNGSQSSASSIKSHDDRFTDVGSIQSTVTASTTPIKKKKNLTVRFADDAGKDLTTTHYTETMYSEDDLDWVRCIILLLSPKKKKFEFIHISYNQYDKSTIASILDQLPGLATDPALKAQEYAGLIRAEACRELINTVPVQSYHLKRDELLVAVIKGVYGKTLMKMAKPLIENKKILRAVSANMACVCKKKLFGFQLF